MVTIPETAINVWRSYYFSANSVGYLVEKAENDLSAKSLSSLSADDLLKSLKGYLSTEPKDTMTLVAPYILVTALYLKSDSKLDAIESLNAPHTKWFREFSTRLFSKRKSILSSTYLNFEISGNTHPTSSSKMSWYST